ncbi:hypothetical protein BC938DRAFT_475594 [Jimgerdemannia flammicorona]|uniref:Uncharacterized protein n=1 Tax=Jimgerdemannia flammicorona TaxID=994334 RepID=A0A433QRF6_9FUNG|nr:hypothetical protein BC938DRAFT_475594 [Jimgerdemannia flammicorona]
MSAPVQHGYPQSMAVPVQCGYPQLSKPMKESPDQDVHVITHGVCSKGGFHAIQKDYDYCGKVLSVLFFPIEALCCVVMSRNKCVKCGTHIHIMYL